MSEKIVNVFNAFNIEFWGKLALFCPPELRSEPYSYRIPTYAAIRNMLEAIYWHPTASWVVERVAVMNEPAYVSMAQNCVNKRMNAEDLMKNPLSVAFYREGSDYHTLRNTVYLSDVRYEVTARILHIPQEGETPEEIQAQNCKVWHIVNNRLKSGGAYRTPYFGRSECQADFRKAEAGPYMSKSDLGDEDFGFMYFDRDYNSNDGQFPLVAHVTMENGVIDYGKILREMRKEYPEYVRSISPVI